MQFRFSRIIWMWIVLLPHDHRDATRLTLGDPALIVFVIPLGETRCFTQFTRSRYIHNLNCGMPAVLADNN